MNIRQPLTAVFASLALLAGCSGDINAVESVKVAGNMKEYRALSEHFYQLDQKALQAEVQQAGLKKPLDAPATKRFGFDAQRATSNAEFIASVEGRHIADVVLSFQTPSGGWSKRTDMGSAPRKPGQKFGKEKDYVPTFDNYATSVQFWVMVNACNATGEQRYCDSALRALQLVITAQYPNGGWPQTFPLRGKYHDDITFNDDAIANLLNLVGAVARGDARLAFVPEPLQKQARASLARGLQMLVDTQVAIDGEPTIWGAQHDAETLLPTSARAFEPVALATSESADLVLFMMSLDNPPPAVARAIESAVAWFEARKINGFRYERAGHSYKELITDEEASPLWARFYDIDSDRPVFGDRNGEVYFDLNQVSEERRAGYGWYTERPYKVLKEFRKWKKKPQP
ncbi:pectate lyase [Microbulbifer aggregans]|uniref:pectate lyase n=1 Tax=Microbulbifer aggregans TaxID=1769779 RepID=UPI001CFD33FE|nr:pectate lyase [Microbulbifer aggregans]